MHPLVEGEVVEVPCGTYHDEWNLRHTGPSPFAFMALVLTKHALPHAQFGFLKALAVYAEVPAREAQHRDRKFYIALVTPPLSTTIVRRQPELLDTQAGFQSPVMFPVLLYIFSRERTVVKLIPVI